MKKKINKKIIKFGILGLGRVVEKRVAQVFLKELNNSKVVIVFDKIRKKREKYKKLFNCKSANSLNEFLKEKLDYIYIATDSGNHYKNILDCFRFNHNVIVEKPPVLRLNHLLILDKISKKKKLDFFVVYQNRFNSSVKILKKSIYKKIKNKLIFSNLDLLWSRNQNYYYDWHGKWSSDGGVIAQQGIHYLDLLCYIFGPPLKCIGYLSNKTNKLQAEDTHAALIIFKNNISCTINFTTALRPQDIEASLRIVARDLVVKLYGLCCNKISIESLNKKNSFYKKISYLHSKEVPNGYGLSHKDLFQNIIDFNLGNKKSKVIKAIDTINTLKLVNMLYMSFEKKKWIFSDEKNIRSKLGY
jgi:UDP-N-acetyl-2-amino-2-deoxyglucuronate dehydrogenase